MPPIPRDVYLRNLAHTRDPNSFQLLQQAAARFPRVEVEQIKKSLGPGDPPLNDEDIVLALVTNRWYNRICNRPGCDALVDLELCRGGCLCTWYCGPTCSEADAAVHRGWCANTQAPEPDAGPLRTVLVRRATG